MTEDQDQRPWDPDELVELLPVATPVATPVAEPEYKTAVIVLEFDPERVHDAVGQLARFARELTDQTLLGPTMHVAIEDKAEEVLTVFEKAPEISESGS
jgi:hypothetical protein